jgi:hypothetical protein
MYAVAPNPEHAVYDFGYLILRSFRTRDVLDSIYVAYSLFYSYHSTRSDDGTS